MRRVLRGQAEVIGALLAVIAIVIVVFYVMNAVMPALQRQVVQSGMRQLTLYEQRLEDLSAVYDTELGMLKINNTGAIEVRIVRIWYKTPDGRLSFVSLQGGNVISLPPGQGIRLTVAALEALGLPSDAIPVMLVTARGNTFPVRLPQEIVIRQAEYASVASALEVTPVTGLLNAKSIDDLLNSPDIYVPQQLFEEPTLENVSQGQAYGMIRYYPDGSRAGLVLVEKRENVYIVLESYLGDDDFIDVEESEYLALGAAYIGLTPQGRPVDCYRDSNLSYNMLLTGPGLRDDDSIDFPKIYFFDPVTRVRLGLIDVHELVEAGSYGRSWRVKIVGFKPTSLVLVYQTDDWVSFTITDSRDLCNFTGLWWLYGLSGEAKVRIYLEGYAEAVEVYIEKPGVTASSYAPYTIIMDVDRNGLPEIVFTTEDGYTAAACGIDDYYSYIVWRRWWPTRIRISMLDASQPINEANCTFASSLAESGIYKLSACPVLIFLNGTNYAINGAKYSMVLISSRVYYHDSEGGDTDCVSSPRQFMIGFFLVDPGPDSRVGTADDQIVSSHMLMYQQLDDWEDTWPPNVNFVSVTATLLVPDVDKNFYVAVGFLDPYNGTSGVDDVEFTAAVEVVGLALFARGG